MDYRDYYLGFYSDYYRDPFPHSLLSTREIRFRIAPQPADKRTSKSPVRSLNLKKSPRSLLLPVRDPRMVLDPCSQFGVYLTGS